jgi:hypothetical protein
MSTHKTKMVKVLLLTVLHLHTPQEPSQDLSQRLVEVEVVLLEIQMEEMEPLEVEVQLPEEVVEMEPTEMMGETQELEQVCFLMHLQAEAVEARLLPERMEQLEEIFLYVQVLEEMVEMG